MPAQVAKIPSWISHNTKFAARNVQFSVQAAETVRALCVSGRLKHFDSADVSQNPIVGGKIVTRDNVHGEVALADAAVGAVFDCIREILSLDIRSLHQGRGKVHILSGCEPNNVLRPIRDFLLLWSRLQTGTIQRSLTTWRLSFTRRKNSCW